jgi:hypothetical protein
MADASCGLRGVIIGLEIALKRGTEANIMNLGRHALTKGTKISISMAFAMMNGEKIRTPLCIFLVIMYSWIYICPSPGSLGWLSRVKSLGRLASNKLAGEGRRWLGGCRVRQRGTGDRKAGPTRL